MKFDESKVTQGEISKLVKTLSQGDLFETVQLAYLFLFYSPSFQKFGWRKDSFFPDRLSTEECLDFLAWVVFTQLGTSPINRIPADLFEVNKIMGICENEGVSGIALVSWLKQNVNVLRKQPLQFAQPYFSDVDIKFKFIIPLAILYYNLPATIRIDKSECNTWSADDEFIFRTIAFTNLTFDSQGGALLWLPDHWQPMIVQNARNLNFYNTNLGCSAVIDLVNTTKVISEPDIKSIRKLPPEFQTISILNCTLSGLEQNEYLFNTFLNLLKLPEKSLVFKGSKISQLPDLMQKAILRQLAELVNKGVSVDTDLSEFELYTKQEGMDEASFQQYLAAVKTSLPSGKMSIKLEENVWEEFSTTQRQKFCQAAQENANLTVTIGGKSLKEWIPTSTQSEKHAPAGSCLSQLSLLTKIPPSSQQPAQTNQVCPGG